MTNGKEVKVYEVITRSQSLVGAKRAIEQMAVMGKFTAVDFNEHGIVFEKATNGERTQLSIRKEGAKVFLAVKQIFNQEQEQEQE